MEVSKVFYIYLVKENTVTFGHCEKEIFMFFCESGRGRGQLVCLLCKSSSRLEKLWKDWDG